VYQLIDVTSTYSKPCAVISLQDGAGDFYSLESVTFFIKNIMAGGATMGQNMGAYVAAAVRLRAQQIILQDRQVRAA
jgi:hypothetical protein